ncbi:endogenous retrovirus group K member 11 Pol protein-like [Podarcis lilfordi]|uniref:RNA-directed DNA polymerase n=1 Tax=Podarcis lilfordi TaxID=74358 RepID=A0AA35LNQ6_9SAUR|nr:endogenous retrovirus group K member 11 Pol protein-like [Podarcis lilfordi]
MRLHWVDRAILNVLLDVVIMADSVQPFAALIQSGPSKVHIIEWLYLHHTPKNTVTPLVDLLAQLISKGRRRCKILFGIDCRQIIEPMPLEQWETVLSTSMDLQCALADFVGLVDCHIPADPCLQMGKQFSLSFSSILSPVPLDAPTVFTDGAPSRGVVAWQQNEEWHSLYTLPQKSAQRSELAAAVKALHHFSSQPINLVVDSLYVANVITRLQGSYVSPLLDDNLLSLFLSLQLLLSNRSHPLFVVHIRSHQPFPGFLTDGNAKADSLLRALPVSPIESHAFHHQNAKALSCQFQIPLEAARAIIQQCPQCSNQIGHPSPGVNPRGLEANQLWQMDVTHFSPFSPWKFIHVCIDTFSGFIWATPQRGEQVKHVCNHHVRTMSVMGKPHSLKTDKAPAYCAKTFAQFCETWNIHHLFGIPYNSQGQAIVERANRTLKTALIRQEKKAGVPASLSEKEGWLASVLFTLNHLNISIQDHQSYTRLQKHFQQREILPAPLVRYKMLSSTEWSEPVKLITWGKGYAAVSTPQGACWVPARCVRLYHGMASGPKSKPDTAARPPTPDRPGCGVQPPQDSQAGKS